MRANAEDLEDKRALRWGLDTDSLISTSSRRNVNSHSGRMGVALIADSVWAYLKMAPERTLPFLIHDVFLQLLQCAEPSPALAPPSLLSIVMRDLRQVSGDIVELRILVARTDHGFRRLRVWEDIAVRGKKEGVFGACVRRFDKNVIEEDE